MTCQQVQSNLSLYLYGELEFAAEEAVESHLETCAFCQLALGREKAWHASLKTDQADVPLDLLSACRRDLDRSLRQGGRFPNELSLLNRLGSFFRFSPTWTARAATAGLLIITGFGAGRWTDQKLLSLPPRFAEAPFYASTANPYTRVRSVQETQPGQVRIVVDQVSETALAGPLADDRIRQEVLAACRRSQDPGIRVDSVVVLSQQPGADVRDALLESAQQDPNAAVRLKAVEGLRSFAGDQQTRAGLIEVLKTDQDASVRSAAIDVLLPARQPVSPSPDLLRAFQQIVESQPGDDYVRARCTQAMHIASASPNQVY